MSVTFPPEVEVPKIGCISIVPFIDILTHNGNFRIHTRSPGVYLAKKTDASTCTPAAITT